MCPMCAPRLQPRRLWCCAMHVNHARLTLNQMDAMPSQREGQGFESPKLHHCGLTRTLATRDAVEQGGTGTYPSSGVPWAPFGVPILWARVWITRRRFRLRGYRKSLNGSASRSSVTSSASR